MTLPDDQRWRSIVIWLCFVAIVPIVLRTPYISADFRERLANGVIVVDPPSATPLKGYPAASSASDGLYGNSDARTEINAAEEGIDQAAQLEGPYSGAVLQQAEVLPEPSPFATQVDEHSSNSNVTIHGVSALLDDAPEALDSSSHLDETGPTLHANIDPLQVHNVDISTAAASEDDAAAGFTSEQGTEAEDRLLLPDWDTAFADVLSMAADEPSTLPAAMQSTAAVSIPSTGPADVPSIDAAEELDTVPEDISSVTGSEDLSLVAGDVPSADEPPALSADAPTVPSEDVVDAAVADAMCAAPAYPLGIAPAPALATQVDHAVQDAAEQAVHDEADLPSSSLSDGFSSGSVPQIEADVPTGHAGADGEGHDSLLRQATWRDSRLRQAFTSLTELWQLVTTAVLEGISPAAGRTGGNTTTVTRDHLVTEDVSGSAAHDSVAQEQTECGQQPEEGLADGQRQHLQQCPESAQAGTTLDAVVYPPGALVTPQMMRAAYLRLGPWYSLFAAVSVVLVALAVNRTFDFAIRRLTKASRALQDLPSYIRSSKEAREARILLRQRFLNEQGLWRLVGVSGTAVYRAVQAQCLADSTTNKSRGAAAFARQLLQRQKQRAASEKQAAVAARETELIVMYEQQLADAAAAHEEQVAAQQAEIQQHVQRYEQQSDVLHGVRADKAELKAQVRQQKEVIAEQRATMASLGQQLQEERQARSAVQDQFDLFKQDNGKDEVWRHALQDKIQEGKVREDVLNTKCEALREDLSAAHKTISQLTVDNQHKSDALAAQADKQQQVSNEHKDLQTCFEQQKQQLSDMAGRMQDLQVQLAAECSQHEQTRMSLKHEVVQRQTAQESLSHEREQRQASLAKAEALQQELTSRSQQLSDLQATHSAAVQNMGRLEADLDALREQHNAAVQESTDKVEALQQQLLSSEEQLAQYQQQVAALKSDLQQTQDTLCTTQQELEEQKAAAARQEVDIEQLIEEYEQERVKLADAQKLLQEAVTSRDRAEERCAALEQQGELQEQEAEVLAQRLEVCQGQLDKTSSLLKQKKLALQEAQNDLSVALEKYEQEDARNRELGQENGHLQSRVYTLEQHERQLTEELEEVTEQVECLSTDHEALLSEHKALRDAMQSALVEVEVSLKDTLAKGAQLNEQLQTAEADVAGLKREREELNKKLYWAEMARDQTKAAKALAAEDAIRARQALTEEKLRKQTAPVRTVSLPGGRGVVAASMAARLDGSSPTPPWLRTNSSTPAKKWGTVEPAYLHQHFKGPDGKVHRCGSPTRSTSNSGSTPGTPRSTSTSAAGDGSSTQRSRKQVKAQGSGSTSPAAAAAAADRLTDPEGDSCDGSTHAPTASEDAAAVAAAAAAPKQSAAPRRQRRAPQGASSSSSTASRLQECSKQQKAQQLSPQEGNKQPREGSASSLKPTKSSGSSDAGAQADAVQSGVLQSPRHAVAAAAEGLRRNFSDAADAPLSDKTTNTAPGTSATCSTTNNTCTALGEAHASLPSQSPSNNTQSNVSESCGHQQQQQQEREEYPEGTTGTLLQPLEQEVQQPVQQGGEPSSAPGTISATSPMLQEGGNSPSLCSTRSRLAGDGSCHMDLRALALSPVQQSSDIQGGPGGETDSPSVSFSSRITAAAAAAAATSSSPQSILATAAAGVSSSPQSVLATPAAGAQDRSDPTLPQTAVPAGAASSWLEAQGSAVSGVSAPSTPVAAPAAEEELKFFTPLPQMRSSTSSSSADCCSPGPADSLGAAAANCAGHHPSDPLCSGLAAGQSAVDKEPATPYFTPLLPSAAAHKAAAAEQLEENSCLPFAEPCLSTAAEETPQVDAKTATATTRCESIDSGDGDAGSGTGGLQRSASLAGSTLVGTSPASVDSPSKPAYVQDDAPLDVPCSGSSGSSSHGGGGMSFLHTCLDDADVLIGSLTEGEFAVLGLGHVVVDSQLQAPHLEHDDHVPDAADGLQAQQQQPGAVAQVADIMSTSPDTNRGGLVTPLSSSTAALRTSSSYKPGSSSSKPQGVPRLPLFQLHASVDGCQQPPRSDPRSTTPSDDVDPDFEITSEDLADTGGSSGSSSGAGRASGSEGTGHHDCDTDSESDDGHDGSNDGSSGSDHDGCDDDTPSDPDVEPPPVSMFIAHVLPAVAVAGGNGAAVNSPRALHSPRYLDQRTARSPRYPSRQKQRVASEVQAGAGCSSPPSVLSPTPLTAPGLSSGVSLGSGGPAGTQDLQDNRPIEEEGAVSGAEQQAAGGQGSKAAGGASGGASPTPHNAGSPAATSVPTAAAAGGSPPCVGLVVSRRSSRLSQVSDTTGSSCSSIASLVAQQQQQQRTACASGSGGVGSGASVLDLTSAARSLGDRANSLEQGITSGSKQQRLQRCASVGGSPRRPAGVVASASGPEQPSLLRRTWGLDSSSGEVSGGQATGAAALLGRPGLVKDQHRAAHTQQRSRSSGAHSSKLDLLQQQQHRGSFSPAGSLAESPSSSFQPPPGPFPRPLNAAALAPAAAVVCAPGQSSSPAPRSSVLWQSLDDFVHAARASNSPAGRRSSGGGAAAAGPQTGASTVGPAASLSPPVALTASSPGTPAGRVAAAAAAASVEGLEARSEDSGVGSSSERCETPAATAAGGLLSPATAAVVAVTPVGRAASEGVREGSPLTDSPDSSCFTGEAAGSGDLESSPEGREEAQGPGGWKVQQNDLYFEHDA